MKSGKMQLMNTPAFPSSDRTPAAQIEKARQLVLRHGWNSTSYQIINPGIQRWFDESNDAVVGFVPGGGVRVVAGAPICPRDNFRAVLGAFERMAADAGDRVCYFAAESRLESIYDGNPNYSKMLLGGQPVWDPRDWADTIKRHKSLRAQLNRARNKKVQVEEWPHERASDDPDLIRCLGQWLGAKGLPPLHFMVEPWTLSRLFDRRIFVARCEEVVVGFLILSPVRQRNGWLFEQFIHRPGSPNGTVELMIDTAMRSLAGGGYEYATLGLAPLSARAGFEQCQHPLWLRLLLAWMRLHGRRFYNFEGLDAFKAKLQPNRWEPVFAISNERRLSVRTVYAIAAAFSENRPFALICGGLWKAVATEFKWLVGKAVRT